MVDIDFVHNRINELLAEPVALQEYLHGVVTDASAHPRCDVRVAQDLARECYTRAQVLLSFQHTHFAKRKHFKTNEVGCRKALHKACEEFLCYVRLVTLPGLDDVFPKEGGAA